jgi:TonB family protein
MATNLKVTGSIFRTAKYFFGFFTLGLAAFPLLLPASAHAAPKETKPRKPEVQVYHHPLYPRDLLLQKISGSATVVFVVNSRGLVESPVLEKASHRLFGAAALAAVAHWKYVPRLRDDRYVAAKVRQKFLFRPTTDSYFSLELYDPTLKPVPLLPLVGPRAKYPEALKSRQIKGHADVILTISPAGKVTQAKLEKSTDPAFGAPAVEAARQWQFSPFDPNAKHLKEKGTRPLYLHPDYGSYQARLTLLFDPASSNRPPLDMKNPRRP